jgi:hypothetical protein
MSTRNQKTDIRWVQRFSNFQKALKQLQNFLSKDPLSELEEHSLQSLVPEKNWVIALFALFYGKKAIKVLK